MGAKFSLPQISIEQPGNYVLVPADRFNERLNEATGRSTLADYLDFPAQISIQNYIRLYRECRGETLKDVANALKVKGASIDPQFLQKIETRRAPLTQKTLDKLILLWGAKFKNGVEFFTQSNEAKLSKKD